MDVTELSLFIGGEWVSATAPDRIEVRNPAAPREVVGTLSRALAEDVDRAVASAKSAFPAWRDTPVEERCEILSRFADGLQGLTEQTATLVTQEMGKILMEAFFDAAFGEMILRTVVGEAPSVLSPEVHADEFGQIIIRQAPRGVAAAIAPWNWPIGLMYIKIAQALATGNTVVALPSPYGSLGIGKTFEAAAETLPPGILNLITGYGPEAGVALTSHRDVRKVAFTGGIETGKAVMHSMADTLKHPTLELGGNDPAVILDDVEITAELGAALATAAFTTSGQICFALKRVYAPRKKAAELAEAVWSAASAAVVGNGLHPEVTMGPLANEAQSKRFSGMMENAARGGASVRSAGSLSPAADPEGYFHLPSVLTGVSDDMPIVADEQFGPALPILSYDDEAEAIQRANASEFGLKSSVWSADAERARAVATKLEAGTTFVNQHGVTAVDLRFPLGGTKQSGIGRELGAEGLLAYTETHQINDRHAPLM